MQKSTDSPNNKQKYACDGLMIPKHRFDCVNLCLKDTKQALKEKTEEAELYHISATALEKALINSKTETALALQGAKNLTAAKALINFSVLKMHANGSVLGLDEQILHIKQKNKYLFEVDDNTAYVLFPLKNTTFLSESIAAHIKQNRSVDE